MVATGCAWLHEPLGDGMALASDWFNMDTLFALNRKTKVATIMRFNSWEALQGAFRVGICLPDGSYATGIGRCPSLSDFVARAQHGGWTVASY